jgi:hypothetical protein
MLGASPKVIIVEPDATVGSTYHLRAQTSDNVDNWSDWTTLFTLQSPKGRYTYDDQSPIISNTTPADGSVITTSMTGLLPGQVTRSHLACHTLVG